MNTKLMAEAQERAKEEDTREICVLPHQMFPSRLQTTAAENEEKASSAEVPFHVCPAGQKTSDRAADEGVGSPNSQLFQNAR